MRGANVLELLRRSVLPAEYARAQPKRLTFAMLTAMGQVVCPARRVLLK